MHTCIDSQFKPQRRAHPPTGDSMTRVKWGPDKPLPRTQNRAMTQRLFIYGTLMPGLRLEAQMQGARFVGAAQVPGRLVDVGRYPGLWLDPHAVEGSNSGQVTGEVYEVDAAHLVRLDVVEGVVPSDRAASQYWREEVTVAAGPMKGQRVQTYVYNRPIDGCTPIAHGDYRRHIREVGRES